THVSRMSPNSVRDVPGYTGAQPTVSQIVYIYGDDVLNPFFLSEPKSLTRSFFSFFIKKNKNLQIVYTYFVLLTKVTAWLHIIHRKKK
ncbi:hypothetical protein, partial [Legionella steelei]|uniref:hypothetical protein n=2 Tax=Legionella TaxID=445 RepID=UPI002FDB6C28